MPRILSLVLMVLALSAPLSAAWLEGPDLLGAQHSIPEELSGTPAVLVFGFTNDSKHVTQPWTEALLARQAAKGGFELYLVALLERAPGLVMPMIKNGLRKRHPKGRHGHVLILRKDTARWEQELGYDKEGAPDQAYLVVLDRQGKPAWKGVGGKDLGTLPDLEAALARALKKKRP